MLTVLALKSNKQNGKKLCRDLNRLPHDSSLIAWLLSEKIAIDIQFYIVLIQHWVSSFYITEAAKYSTLCSFLLYKCDHVTIKKNIIL